MVSLLLTGALFFSVAHADETTEEQTGDGQKSVITMEKMTVVADDAAQDTVLDAGKIEREQAWTTNDLFRNIPQVEVGGGSPNARRLYLRGIADSLLNITVDGARQNKDLRCSRGSLTSFDADLLKTVNVDAGPLAADQGYGGLGGSIKLTTKDAQDMLTGSRPAGFLAKTSYASASEGWKHSAAAYGVIRNIGLLLYVTDMDADDYDAGNGHTMLGTAEDQRDYFAKFSMLDVKDNDLRVSYQHNKQEGLYAWTRPGDMGQLTDESLASRQKLKQETITVNHSFHPNSPFIHTKLNYYNVETEMINEDFDNKYRSEGQGGGVKNTFSFGWGEFSSKLTVGADYTEEDGIASGCTVSTENVGGFAQNRFKYKIFSLSFGVRYDDFENDFDGKKVDGDAVSPNVSGSVDLGYGFSVFAGYGRSVSGANTIPVNWLTNLSPDLTFNGKEDGSLSPEKSTKVECGFKYRKRSLFFASDNFNFTATFYRTKIEDVIVAGTGGSGMKPISDIINDDDDLESEGFELVAEWGYGPLDAYLAYTCNDVEQGGESVTETIKRTATSSGNLITFNLLYQHSEELDFGYSLVVVQENHDADRDSELRDGYTLHGLQAQYHPKSLQGLTISLAVNNLFDESYASQTSMTRFGHAVLEPGRDVRVAVSYQF